EQVRLGRIPQEHRAEATAHERRDPDQREAVHFQRARRVEERVRDLARDLEFALPESRARGGCTHLRGTHRLPRVQESTSGERGRSRRTQPALGSAYDSLDGLLTGLYCICDLSSRYSSCPVWSANAEPDSELTIEVGPAQGQALHTVPCAGRGPMVPP